MNNIFIRLLLIGLASVGLYKTFPQISKPVDYYIKGAKFQQSVVTPVVKIANSVLPSKLQFPTPSVMGASTENQGPSPLEEITKEVSRQAADLAGNQVVQIRKTATESFCKVLIEKIKTDCAGSLEATPSSQN